MSSGPLWEISAQLVARLAQNLEAAHGHVQEEDARLDQDQSQEERREQGQEQGRLPPAKRQRISGAGHRGTPLVGSSPPPAVLLASLPQWGSHSDLAWVALLSSWDFHTPPSHSHTPSSHHRTPLPSGSHSTLGRSEGTASGAPWVDPTLVAAPAGPKAPGGKTGAQGQATTRRAEVGGAPGRGSSAKGLGSQWGRPGVPSSPAAYQGLSWPAAAADIAPADVAEGQTGEVAPAAEEYGRLEKRVLLEILPLLLSQHARVDVHVAFCEWWERAPPGVQIALAPWLCEALVQASILHPPANTSTTTLPNPHSPFPTQGPTRGLQASSSQGSLAPLSGEIQAALVRQRWARKEGQESGRVALGPVSAFSLPIALLSGAPALSHSPPLTAVVVSLLRRYLRICTRLCQLAASLGPSSVSRTSKGPKDPSRDAHSAGGSGILAHQRRSSGADEDPAGSEASGEGVESALFVWKGLLAQCLLELDGAGPGPGAGGVPRASHGSEVGGDGGRWAVGKGRREGLRAPLALLRDMLEDEPQLLQLLLGQVSHKSHNSHRSCPALPGSVGGPTLSSGGQGGHS